MNGWQLALSVLALAGGVLLVGRARATTIRSSTAPAPGASPIPTLGAALEELQAGARRALGAAWAPPASASLYLGAIRTAELVNGIPSNLLARLLYQESRFRADVITGQVQSSAGALGIAQIVPRWHPGVDPLEPFGAIRYAGKYLASLKQRFGSWDKALAAYNWGQGNLARVITRSGAAWLGDGELPRETRAYVTEILADVPGAVS